MAKYNIFLSFVLSLVSAQVISQTNAPNIILFLIDDQGWGATSVKMDDRVADSQSDYVRTPNLQKLAGRGIIFSNGYAPHPNCSPSRASILTGKSPAQLNMTDIIGRHTGSLYEGNFLIPPQHINELPDEEWTIAEWIKTYRPQYKAAHFGKWHLANGGPAQHGFDAGDGPTSNREGNQNPPEDPKRIYSITQRSIDWMQEQVDNKHPFYLQISHYAVHLPIQMSPSALMETSKWPEGERHNQTGFAAMANDVDKSMGLVFEQLKRLGIEDDTYIIYTSDNGTYPTNSTANINGPLHGWKATLWEAGIRVPFIIAGPGIKPGRSHERVVGFDLFPTICELLDIGDLPDGLEGGSLESILSGKQTKVSRPDDFLVFHFPHYQLQKASHPATALYKDKYKLISFYETGDSHLYDLEQDISETENLAYIYPELVEQLEGFMGQYLKKIGADLPVINQTFHPDKDPGRSYKARKQRLMKEPYFLLNK
ncbi:MAG: sulfatase [Bacteroidota bacterium]